MYQLLFRGVCEMNQLIEGGLIKQIFDSTAIFSHDGKYRYLLKREWEKDGNNVLFIMLNPSTADAFVFDPTVKRCFDFAHAWGYTSMSVCNLYAFRSTDPKKLKAEIDPVGKDNNEWLYHAGSDARMIIAAWGTQGTLLRRDQEVITLITTDLGKDLYCLEMTKEGHPKHPLYMKGDTKPRLFHRQSGSIGGKDDRQ